LFIFLHVILAQSWVSAKVKEYFYKILAWKSPFVVNDTSTYYPFMGIVLLLAVTGITVFTVFHVWFFKK
jgi:hypothetical protein